jgi:hypothetical protein
MITSGSEKEQVTMSASPIETIELTDEELGGMYGGHCFDRQFGDDDDDGRRRFHFGENSFFHTSSVSISISFSSF